MINTRLLRLTTHHNYTAWLSHRTSVIGTGIWLRCRNRIAHLPCNYIRCFLSIRWLIFWVAFIFSLKNLDPFLRLFLVLCFKNSTSLTLISISTFESSRTLDVHARGVVRRSWYAGCHRRTRFSLAHHLNETCSWTLFLENMNKKLRFATRKLFRPRTASKRMG